MVGFHQLFVVLSLLQASLATVSDDVVAFNKLVNQINLKFTNAEDRQTRFNNFVHAKAKVDELKKSYPNLDFGVNQFSLMSEDELSKYLASKDAGKKPTELRAKRSALDNSISTTYPTSYDFRDFGVTSVKDQKGFPDPRYEIRDDNCNSAWAHATVAAVESQYLLRYNQSLDLSEQYLVDCHLIAGCIGDTSTYTAFEYVTANGLPLESCLPYIGNEHNMGLTCEQCPQKYAIEGYQRYGFTEDDIAKNIYNKGPAAATFWVPQHMLPTLFAYKSGIWDVTSTDCANMKATDCMMPVIVLIVGYTPDFWIAKNSWGTSWGLSGYIHIKRTTSFCGLKLEGVYGPYLNITIQPDAPTPAPTTTTLAPTTTTTVSNKCASGWTYYAPTNACYRHVEGKDRTQAEVEKWCNNQGKKGSLVSIHNEAENTFVKSLIPAGANNVLIGYNNQAWTDATPNDYSNWATTTETTNACATLSGPTWTSASCNGPFQHFVCKRNP